MLSSLAPIKEMFAIHQRTFQNIFPRSEPTLHADVWAFVSIPSEANDVLTSLSDVDVLATFKEEEGLTLIVREEIAIEKKWKIGFR